MDGHLKAKRCGVHDQVGSFDNTEVDDHLLEVKVEPRKTKCVWYWMRPSLGKYDKEHSKAIYHSGILRFLDPQDTEVEELRRYVIESSSTISPSSDPAQPICLVIPPSKRIQIFQHSIVVVAHRYFVPRFKMIESNLEITGDNLADPTRSAYPFQPGKKWQLVTGLEQLWRFSVAFDLIVDVWVPGREHILLLPSLGKCSLLQCIREMRQHVLEGDKKLAFECVRVIFPCDFHRQGQVQLKTLGGFLWSARPMSSRIKLINENDIQDDDDDDSEISDLSTRFELYVSPEEGRLMIWSCMQKRYVGLYGQLLSGEKERRVFYGWARGKKEEWRAQCSWELSRSFLNLHANTEPVKHIIPLRGYFKGAWTQKVIIFSMLVHVNDRIALAITNQLLEPEEETWIKDLSTFFLKYDSHEDVSFGEMTLTVLVGKQVEVYQACVRIQGICQYINRFKIIEREI